MATRSGDREMTIAAVITAAAMIAGQVGGKAIRDALFLSRYPVTALPAVLLVTAALSVGAALLAARALTSRGPHRVIPATFGASAALMLATWRLGPLFPRGQAVTLYLLVSVLGMVQISGFWSLVNESYDPRTAKKRIGRIAAGGTLGGLIGGLLAERIGSMWGISLTMPMLAGLHALCAVCSLRLRPLRRRPTPASPDGAQGRREGATRLGLRVLGQTPYLRCLAGLVLLSTLAAAFVDYVFKMRASEHMSGPALLRLFAGFYTAVGLVTFVIQTAASRRVLERVGLARTVATLPLGVAAGGLGALMAPGLVTAGIARGAETVLRNSFYRSGYEVLFAPIPAREKRATKTIVDVGIERLGDALAAAIIQLVVLLTAVMTAPLLLGLAIVCSVAGIATAQRLRGGYVETLERNLLSQAEELDLRETMDPAASMTFTENMAPITWAADTATGIFARPRQTLDASRAGVAADPRAEPEPVDTARAGVAGQDDPAREPFFRRVRELRSGDPERVRKALDAGPIDRALAPHVIPLLAWETVAEAAGQALRAASDPIAGQLVDSLLDPEEEFAIRRRIPRLLCDRASSVAVEGLLQGLLDRRFEVRFRCGRALLRLHEGVGILPPDPDRIYLAVLREVAVDRRVWESQKLLELSGEDDDSPFVDSVLRERASRSLEHVFTVLALALPQQPLQVAFRGLYADDPALRGTALEYLESILPPHVRDALWPLIEDRRPRAASHRSREEILADLVRSNESIEIDLRAFRRRQEAP